MSQRNSPPPHDASEEMGTERFAALILAVIRLLKSAIPVIPNWIDKSAVQGAVANGSLAALESLRQNAADIARVALGGQLTLVLKFIAILTECEARVMRQYNKACKDQDGMDSTICIDENATDLSGMDVATIVMIALVSIGLLLLPLIGIPQYFLTYVNDNMILAISYSVLGFAGVVTLKGFYEATPTKTGKRRLLICLCLCSFIALGTWICLFSISFGGLLFDEPEQLAPAWVGQLMMISGMISEPLVAASGWITIASIIQFHRPLAPNPEFHAIEKVKQALEKRLTKLRTMLAELHARKDTLESSERIYVHAVISEYEMLRRRWGFFGDDDALGGVVKPSSKPKPSLS